MYIRYIMHMAQIQQIYSRCVINCIYIHCICTTMYGNTVCIYCVYVGAHNIHCLCNIYGVISHTQNILCIYTVQCVVYILDIPGILIYIYRYMYIHRRKSLSIYILTIYICIHLPWSEHIINSVHRTHSIRVYIYVYIYTSYFPYDISGCN